MKKILIGILSAFLFCSIGLAEDSNITITTDSFDNKWYKEVVWFSAYNVGGDTGTAYDYNESQEAGDSAGLVDVKKYNHSITIQIDLITKGSTSIDVRTEGRAGSAAEWGEIATINFTAETGANNAFTFPVNEYLEEIRVGVKANTPGTDSITVSGIMLGENR